MPKDGFSLMTVMIGSVVVAALAVVYMQKAKNKAQVAAIADIIAYRDYVFRYYHEVAVNRMAWQCTLNANTNLKDYVHGRGGALGPHPLELYDVSGTGCALGGGTGELRIGTGVGGGGTEFGRGIKLYTDPTDSVTAADDYDPDNAAHDLRIWTTWEGLGQERVRIRLAATYNYEHEHAITSFKIKEKETFIYMGRTPARNCGESLVGFHDDRGSGNTAPKRYFGDTAVTALDAKTRLIKCWEQGPLVIPPCFDLLERDGGNLSFSTRCPSLGTDKETNYAGMCPHEGQPRFVRAIGGFASNTGKTICERNYALVLGDRQSTGSPYKNKCDGDNNAVLGIRVDGADAHRPTCSRPRGRYGVLGGRANEGIAGWNIGGAVIPAGSRVAASGLQGKQGHPGVRPPHKGDTGAGRSCSCTCPTSACSSDADCTDEKDEHGNVTRTNTCGSRHSICPSYQSCEF